MMEAPLCVADVSTPIGTFRVVYHDRSVRVIDLLEKGVAQTGVPDGAIRKRAPFRAGTPPRQLHEYFRGQRVAFDLDVDPDTGSSFDRTVWNSLIKIPAGQTVSYGELARRAGYAGAARAVGGAMHRNPIPIVIPCHRVVSEDRSLTGFGLGLWRKRWLLDWEGSWPLKSRSVEGPRDRAQRTLEGLFDTTVGRPPARRRRARSKTADGS